MDHILGPLGCWQGGTQTGASLMGCTAVIGALSSTLGVVKNQGQTLGTALGILGPGETLWAGAVGNQGQTLGIVLHIPGGVLHTSVVAREMPNQDRILGVLVVAAENVPSATAGPSMVSSVAMLNQGQTLGFAKRKESLRKNQDHILGQNQDHILGIVLGSLNDSG